MMLAPLVSLEAEAFTSTSPISVPEVTVKLAVISPWGKVTVSGTVASELLLAKLTSIFV